MFPKKKKEDNELIDNMDTELFMDEDSDAADDNNPDTPKKKLPGWVIVPIIGVIILIAVVGSLFAGEPKETTTALTVTEVTTGTVREVYNSSGTIESENSKTYYSPVTAPVLTCNAIVGQPVKSGDLLVTFDTANLERDNQQAQLSLQSTLNSSQAARAQNAQAIDAANAANAAAAEQANALAEQVNQLAEKVNAAADALQKDKDNAASLSVEIQKQRAELQIIIDQKTEELAAYQTAIDNIKGYEGHRTEADELKQKQVQDPNYQLTDAEKNLIEAFDNYDTAMAEKPKAQKALDDANAKMAALQDPVVDDSGYNELKAQYDTAYAQWQAASSAAGASTSVSGMSSTELANLDINDNLAELAALTPAELVAKGKEGMKADMNGVVASVDALEGNTATQGLAMFTIASTDNVRVKIEVSPDDYSKLKEGNAVTITVGEKKYNGTLSRINKIATTNTKGNPVIGAEIHISNPDADICIGATAKISMTVAEAKDVLVVPTEVINTSSDGDFVYVIENGVVKEKAVELGTSSVTQVEIKSGLKKGEQVVSALNVDIKEGMKATAVPENTDADASAN